MDKTTLESNGKTYFLQTMEVAQNWKDSGYRHRVCCEMDSRVSGWASYEQVAYLDDVASVSPYFGPAAETLMPLKDALPLIAVGPDQADASTAPNADDGQPTQGSGSHHG